MSDELEARLVALEARVAALEAPPPARWQGPAFREATVRESYEAKRQDGHRFLALIVALDLAVAAVELMQEIDLRAVTRVTVEAEYLPGQWELVPTRPEREEFVLPDAPVVGS